MPLHILVVEDHALLAKNLADGLELHGHTADFAGNGELGLKLAMENHYDLMILDLGLPGIDGLEVCRRLRKRMTRRMPLLMLTARDALHDKLSGFDSGADDYLVKPFALEELLARCTVLARRHTLNEEHTLAVGTLRIDRQAQAVTRDGQAVKLNPVGYQILLALAEAHPRVITRSELTRKLWYDTPPDSDALRTHLYQLRRSLDKPFGRAMLLTVHGVGFKLDAGA
ncbi:response regulator transcription factor [Massilia sp. CCM 9206]|uniref:response regulator transcription factor n=1 Tax=Massilia pseudoviolaceinigra TaxID=3057165 RepID=UPI002796A33A|nr:response regulator transcription factor [Massilia sp. CCM 9206]MDQ1919235.1 response regulator transcription factor [Massilia sp. CCM 9206]